MIAAFSETGWEDFTYLLNREKKLVAKVRKLIKEIVRHPFTGTGKPESLKHEYAGYWSRRIDKQHRYIIQCRFHYT